MCAVEWKKLGDLCEIRGRIGFRGYTREDQVVKGEGAISLSPANIVDSRLCYDDSTYISWSKYNESPEIKVFNDDLIFCKTASVGKVSMVENLPCEATINPQLVVLKNICVNSKYLYYCLCGNKVQDEVKALAGVGSVPNVSQAKLANILIPIPSLAKQQEIVSHLDTFTTLISNLESELDMRRKQYEHYRNQLLDFEGVEGVEWKALKNIANFRNGKGHEKSIDSEGSYIIVNSKFISTNGLVKKYCNVQISPLYKDDILMVMSDLPNGKALARCYLVEIDNKYTLNQRICALNVKDESIVRTKYLYIILNRNKQLLEYDNGVDQTNLRKDDILNIHIPIPSLATQQEIVEKLDAFENLIQSLEQEIKLRKQQYEYYREKLLTFEKE